VWSGGVFGPRARRPRRGRVHASSLMGRRPATGAWTSARALTETRAAFTGAPACKRRSAPPDESVNGGGLHPLRGSGERPSLPSLPPRGPTSASLALAGGGQRLALKTSYCLFHLGSFARREGWLPRTSFAPGAPVSPMRRWAPPTSDASGGRLIFHTQGSCTQRHGWVCFTLTCVLWCLRRRQQRWLANLVPNLARKRGVSLAGRSASFLWFGARIWSVRWVLVRDTPLSMAGRDQMFPNDEVGMTGPRRGEIHMFLFFVSGTPYYLLSEVI
jgi:hypothetical protein